ncbi:hypothetical protein [Mycobacterium angelicum]|uniref:hypothetical protein n=1 Tax=Mycobacterium angelicum TaxID=470074 RepID=UPI00111C8D0A|nr:hypothetical protein [Mycobacterium angelicum]
MGKPRNRTAVVALVLALLACAAAAVAVGLIAASHAWESGCVVDRDLDGAGSLCLVLGGLLSAGAGVTGLVSLLKPRIRGAYLAIGVAATALGGIGLLFCLLLFTTGTSPRAIDPVYLHHC